MQKCPCNSELLYAQCCKKLHDGIAAPDALALMRSRYSAYALGLVQYIIHTTHKNHPAYSSHFAAWKKDLKNFCANTQFKELKILHFQEQRTRACVSFIAHLEHNGQAFDLIEKSTFKKEGGKWLYLEGITYPTQSALLEDLNTSYL